MPVVRPPAARLGGLDTGQKEAHEAFLLPLRPLWKTGAITELSNAMSKTTIIAQPIYADLETVAAMLSVSDSTIQKLTREESSFPKPRKISGRRVGWLIREIGEWAESRPVSDMLPPPNTCAKKGRRLASSEQLKVV